MIDYSQKIVLVTGSRRGVGRLIAEHFLEGGAKVIGFSRGEASIEHPSYTHFCVDISDAQAVQNVFMALSKQKLNLHILVNNASVLTSQYAMILPTEAAQRMINTNLLGNFIVTREAAKMMRKTRWGRIINISSMSVKMQVAGDSVYAATKAGLNVMAEIQAKEFAPLNITCNTLAISAIQTDMLSQLPKEKIEAVVSGLTIPRLAESDDILNVIDFFASERSAYITAQTIYLGGVH